jgi:hypothetical protein
MRCSLPVERYPLPIRDLPRFAWLHPPEGFALARDAVNAYTAGTQDVGGPNDAVNVDILSLWPCLSSPWLLDLRLRHLLDPW